jgi:hypothetical protein
MRTRGVFPLYSNISSLLVAVSQLSGPAAVNRRVAVSPTCVPIANAAAATQAGMRMAVVLRRVAVSQTFSGPAAVNKRATCSRFADKEQRRGLAAGQEKVGPWPVVQPEQPKTDFSSKTATIPASLTSYFTSCCPSTSKITLKKPTRTLCYGYFLYPAC